ncbi:MAG: TIGR03085 family metal-binding protein [Acidimicrobiales bacterium]
MARTALAIQERLALCDLIEELGPDASTLCEGWTTLDLLAHLAVRERDLIGAPGILVSGAVARLTDRAMDRYRAKGFHWLVDVIRTGPPIGPWRLPVLSDRINLHEFYVHHEDVRRANGASPRPENEELDRALWMVLRFNARILARRVGSIGVELTWPGHGSITAHNGSPTVSLVGRPSELALFVNGRPAVADVEIDGPPDAVETLASARLGF